MLSQNESKDDLGANGQGQGQGQGHGKGSGSRSRSWQRVRVKVKAQGQGKGQGHGKGQGQGRLTCPPTLARSFLSFSNQSRVENLLVSFDDPAACTPNI